MTTITAIIMVALFLVLIIKNFLLEEELRLADKSAFKMKLRLEFIKENEIAMAKLREEYRNK